MYRLTSPPTNKVAITRGKEELKGLEDLARALGLELYPLPTIRLEPLLEPEGLKEMVRRWYSRLASDWKRNSTALVLTSPKGVGLLFKLAREAHMEGELMKLLSSVQIYAIGPRTKEALEDEGLKAALPKSYSSWGLLHRLVKDECRVALLLRSDGASPLLREGLQKRGCQVEEVHLYTVRDHLSPEAFQAFLEEVEGRRIKALAFTSPSSARALFNEAERERLKVRLMEALSDSAIIAALGPTTARALRRLGIRVDFTPRRYLLEDLLELLAKRLRRNGGQEP